MPKSIKDCIETDDFNEVYKRFKKATARWKDEWYMAFLVINGNCAECAKKYRIEEAEREIRRIIDKDNSNIKIDTSCNSLLDDSCQKCYLFEFLDENGNLVCSKVGTTTRKVMQRLKEELRSKTYTDMGATTAVVYRVYDCLKYPAEGLESFFRASYIKKYPDSFKKNDRFIKIKFDLKEADEIYADYLISDKNV